MSRRILSANVIKRSVPIYKILLKAVVSCTWSALIYLILHYLFLWAILFTFIILSSYTYSNYYHHRHLAISIYYGLSQPRDATCGCYYTFTTTSPVLNKSSRGSTVNFSLWINHNYIIYLYRCINKLSVLRIKGLASFIFLFHLELGFGSNVLPQRLNSAENLSGF